MPDLVFPTLFPLKGQAFFCLTFLLKIQIERFLVLSFWLVQNLPLVLRKILDKRE